MSRSILRDSLLRATSNSVAGSSGSSPALAQLPRYICIPPSRARSKCPRQSQSQRQDRQYVTASSSSAASTSAAASVSTSGESLRRPQPHQHPAFEALSTELSLSQPCFGARGDEVELLSSPQMFYARLLEMIRRARRRVLISSLYIGVEEGELVEAIRQAIISNPQLRVTFILDYHRSTRLSRPSSSSSTPDLPFPPSTAHMLLPLVEAYPDRCEVWLYRSPKLRGLMEKIVPERYDEGWGTWHGKWYGVDDEVLISGANLASSYFTNRQDRYIHFKQNPSLLSYLTSLTRLFTQYSYLLHHSPPAHISPTAPPSTASLIWPSASIHPRRFSTHALATLTAFQNSWKASNANRSRRVDIDTWFWPVIQSGVLGIKEEEKTLVKVWNAVRRSFEHEQSENSKDRSQVSEKKQIQNGVKVDLTSGYFGLYKEYKKQVLDSPANVDVIAASPKANGFYGSKGFSRLIPEGYTLLESRFYRDAVRRGREWTEEKAAGIRLKEWEKSGWTYHSKGIWISPARSDAVTSDKITASSTSLSASASASANANNSSRADTNPFVTFIGSSNLSTRSLNLDTELSLLLMTSSPTLRKSLAHEVRTINKDSKDVNEGTFRAEDRKVSLLARILVALGVEGML
uniref:CDP-diacylglycerol--glycerol-3-phosphate 3-phosphatidyltransferase n=1 Tax=Kwoniella dejecticola CBS 10117 TaxID=1296121 RepID=A0A1A6AGP9_9TREE|nr:CDP-diacylglycerol-glycerol-3-phosphate 3-phosphatidyltransferase [Kwoniella dejecticola CBS 10117]OBR89250.1 CDP-diacylglycerol-glycerol-3-phosphate 3-phosphatidyltransferase [Kwoniella dejecticola CBS 10117]